MTPAATAPSPRRHLLHLSTLILLVGNLIPLAGVLFWHWDVFLLLMLYWMETVVIAFWTLVRLGTAEGGIAELAKGFKGPSSRLSIVAFFTFHAGIFITVHCVFLWALFSADWSTRIHGLGDFFTLIVVDAGLWLPLLILFVGHGTSYVLHVLKPPIVMRWVSRTFGAQQVADGAPPSEGRIIFLLYSRIIIMQATILIGVWIALALGTIGPLLLLIGLKTVVDVAGDIYGHWRAGARIGDPQSPSAAA